MTQTSEYMHHAHVITNQIGTSCLGEAHSIASTCPIPDGLSYQGTDSFRMASERVVDAMPSEPG